MKKNAVKEALRRGEPQVGTWLTLASLGRSNFLRREARLRAGPGRILRLRSGQVLGGLTPQIWIY